MLVQSLSGSNFVTTASTDDYFHNRAKYYCQNARQDGRERERVKVGSLKATI